MKRAIVILISLTMAFIWIAQPIRAQETGKKILIIPGDLNRPYEIIDGVVHVVDVYGGIRIGDPFEKAIAKGFKELEEAIQTKTDADALINTTIQFELAFKKSATEKIGWLIIFGTLVKYK